MMDMFMYYMLVGTAATLGGVLVLLAFIGVYKLIDNYQHLKQMNKMLAEEKTSWMKRALDKER